MIHKPEKGGKVNHVQCGEWGGARRQYSGRKGKSGGGKLGGLGGKENKGSNGSGKNTGV